MPVVVWVAAVIADVVAGLFLWACVAELLRERRPARRRPARPWPVADPPTEPIPLGPAFMDRYVMPDLLSGEMPGRYRATRPDVDRFGSRVSAARYGGSRRVG